MTDSAPDIEAVFLAALERAIPADRRAFVEQACAGVPEALRRVRELLDCHEQPRGPLDTPPPGVRLDPSGDAERPGVRVGPYTLAEQIGEGGMGLVFVAEQSHPVRRKVALKVIKPGMDTRQVLARFEAERQALALMDHPNITRILDAGSTERGRPYFVMELVSGVPVTAFCEHHRLPLRDRLGLFVSVCRAVQHAHQKGIIHRDLKPSNILVESHDGKPVPKVIDFGIAKAVGHEPAARTADTGAARMIGTPLYMSPEQAGGGREVDTRTDVYSLGVVLYELLTDTTPFTGADLGIAGAEEIRRVIREVEPLPPGVFDRSVRGELEWIVLKCLEKDRARRYDSAADLARDVERYLADEPVEACPPSAVYRLRKFLRRNRTAAGFAALLLAGGVVIAWQGFRLAGAERANAARAAAHAREQANRSREVNAALTRARELREQARSTPAGWATWAEAQAMARRAEALLGDDASDPEATRQVSELLRELAEEAADRRIVARLEEIRLDQSAVDGQNDRFHLERALPEYRKAFREYGLRAGMPAEEAAAVLRRRPPPVHATLVAALDNWLGLARGAKPSEADWLERVLAAADDDPWRRQVRVARARGDRRELERLARDVDVTAQPPQSLFHLDRALHACGARASMVELLRRTQAAYPGDFWTNENLGAALAFEVTPPKFDEAIRFLTAAVALRPDSPGARLNLGLALEEKERFTEAIASVRRATELKPDYATAHQSLGWLLAETAQCEEAVTAHRRAAELLPEFAPAHFGLGLALQRRGRLEEAVAAFRRVLELKPDWPTPYYDLGNTLAELDRPDEAIAAFRRAIQLKPGFAEAQCNLSNPLRLKGDYAAALAAVERGHELGSRRAGWGSDSARWVKEHRLIVEHHARLPAVVRGEVRPADVDECTAYAILCFDQKRYAAAARLRADALTADPRRADDLKAGHRYDAACAAARAGCADTGPADAAERARWRKQAVEWLRADLRAYSQLLQKGTAAERRFVLRHLRQWFGDRELAGLREPDAVARLPDAEKTACERLWAEARALVTKASSPE